MDQRIEIEGIPVEVESRYRIELQQWQSTIRHPVHGFTVCEWAPTLKDATYAAYKALRYYEAEMERELSMRNAVPAGATSVP